MTITGLGPIRVPDGTSARKAILERPGVDATSVPSQAGSDDSGGPGPLGIGLLAAGGIGIAAGLLLRTGGHGRLGAGIAALGGALLGVSLLTGCGTTSNSTRARPSDPVPGDDGAPGEDVALVPDSVQDLPDAGSDTTNPAPADYLPQSGTRDAREGVVQIEHATGLGSGWVVEPGKLITNYHVAHGYEELTVVDHEGERHEGTVERLDRDHDLALVSVPTLEDAPLEMDDVVEQTEFGETTGYPGGSFRNDEASAAFRVDVTDDGRRRDTILFLGESAQGVSGGAVINGAGEVIGTSFAVGALADEDGGETDFVLGIPNDQVRAFLDDAKATEPAPAVGDGDGGER